MSLTLAILLAALFVIVIVSLLFVFHPDYESGLVGVIGLAMVSVAAVSRIDDLLDRADTLGEVRVSPRALLAWVGVALFFGQLAWRFLRRTRAHHHGRQHWRSTGKT